MSRLADITRERVSPLLQEICYTWLPDSDRYVFHRIYHPDGCVACGQQAVTGWEGWWPRWPNEASVLGLTCANEEHSIAAAWTIWRLTGTGPTPLKLCTVP